MEEVWISNPVPGYTYSYQALDSYSLACACGAAAPIILNSTFTVYRSGVPVSTNAGTSYCDGLTPLFRYTY